jgi:hypothetical protein
VKRIIVAVCTLPMLAVAANGPAECVNPPAVVCEGNAVARAAATPSFVGCPPTRATGHVVSGS